MLVICCYSAGAGATFSRGITTNRLTSRCFTNLPRAQSLFNYDSQLMISYMKIILNCPASQLNPFKYSFKVRGMTVQQENYIYWYLSFSLISVPCFCMYLLSSTPTLHSTKLLFTYLFYVRQKSVTCRGNIIIRTFKGLRN